MKLEKPLDKAAKDPACRPAFYHQLLKSDIMVLYLPSDETKLEKGFVHLKKDTNIQIIHLQKEDGRSVMPIFTSIGAIQKGIKNDEPYLQFNARTLFEMTKGASYILNPYSDYAKEFTSEEIDNLLNDKITQGRIHVVDKNTQVLVGQPSNYPHELVNALKRYFAKTSLVQAAYLVKMFITNQDKEPHLVIGIKMPEHNAMVLRDVITVSQTFLTKGELIDFIVVKDNTELIKGVQPFFKNTVITKLKNLFGFFDKE